MKTWWSLALVLVLGFAVVGCGQGTDAALAEARKSTGDKGKDRKAIIDRVGKIEWPKVPEADKKAFIQTFNGDAAEAEMFWTDAVFGPQGRLTESNGAPSR